MSLDSEADLNSLDVVCLLWGRLLIISRRLGRSASVYLVACLVRFLLGKDLVVFVFSATFHHDFQIN